MIYFMVIEKINRYFLVSGIPEEVFGLSFKSIKVSCRAVCEGAALCKVLRIVPELFAG
jgi:hypothetical protein